MGPMMSGEPRNTNRDAQSMNVLSQSVNVFMTFDPFHVSITKVVARTIIRDKVLTNTGTESRAPKVSNPLMSSFTDLTKPVERN